MVNIRFGLFETNSSSTHSLVVMTKAQYKEWLDEEKYLKVKNDFIKPDEIKLYTEEEAWEDCNVATEGNMLKKQTLEEYNYIPSDGGSFTQIVEGEFDDYVVFSTYTDR